jgi:hypothetical protein
MIACVSSVLSVGLTDFWQAANSSIMPNKAGVIFLMLMFIKVDELGCTCKLRKLFLGTPKQQVKSPCLLFT